jgi:hypothetical protein
MGKRESSQEGRAEEREEAVRVNGKQSENGRWCESCQFEHGPHYECPSYPEEIKAEIRAQSEQFRTNLADPAWIQKELENGTPPEVIAIMRAFGGEKA